MKIEVVPRDEPPLNDPVIVCGLPGAALVGKFAVDHLISELSAKSLCEVYSNDFPPQVVIKEDGSATLMHNDLYYWKNEKGSDLILFTSDTQPTTSEAGYLLSEKVIDYIISKYKAKEMIALGAYVTGERKEGSKVYAAGSDLNYAKKIELLGCTLMHGGEIRGMNGLLMGMAKLKGIPGYILLGETGGYGFDGRASESVLLYLQKLVGIQIDFEKLRQRAKEAQKVLDAVVEAEGKLDSRRFPDNEGKKPNYIF